MSGLNGLKEKVPYALCIQLPNGNSNQDDPILINIMDNSDVSARRKARLCFWLLSQKSGVNTGDKTNMY